MALLSNIEYITISNIEYRIFHKYPTNGQISNKKSNIEYLQYLCLNYLLVVRTKVAIMDLLLKMCLIKVALKIDKSP